LEQRWYKNKANAKDDIAPLTTYLEDRISVNEMGMTGEGGRQIRYFHNTVYVTGDIVERPKIPYITLVQTAGKTWDPNRGTPDKMGNVEVSMNWRITDDSIIYLFDVKDDPLDKTRYTAMYVTHANETTGTPINPIVGAITLDLGAGTGTFRTEGHALAVGDMVIRITATNRAGTTYYQLKFTHGVSS
jgi:hypothetical protein